MEWTLVMKVARCAVTLQHVVYAHDMYTVSQKTSHFVIVHRASRRAPVPPGRRGGAHVCSGASC